MIAVVRNKVIQVIIRHLHSCLGCLGCLAWLGS